QAAVRSRTRSGRLRPGGRGGRLLSCERGGAPHGYRLRTSPTSGQLGAELRQSRSEAGPQIGAGQPGVSVQLLHGPDLVSPDPEAGADQELLERFEVVEDPIREGTHGDEVLVDVVGGVDELGVVVRIGPAVLARPQKRT